MHTLVALVNMCLTLLMASTASNVQREESSTFMNDLIVVKKY